MNNEALRSILPKKSIDEMGIMLIGAGVEPLAAGPWGVPGVPTTDRRGALNDKSHGKKNKNT